MRRQPKLIPYDPSSFYSDGRAMRQPPAGTVPRELWGRPELLTGQGPDGAYVRRLPVPLTEELLALGERRFRSTCAACHGLLGDGRSVVASKMALRPPANLLERLVDLEGRQAR